MKKLSIVTAVAYANIRTAISPGGEIRGQIRASRHKDKD